MDLKEATTRIKDAVDLAALIEGYGVPLRQAGRNLVGLCPFHQEKTPSFTVYVDSQHFKCYGCGKAGDAFTFVMEREGVEFREAFEMLAQRAGIATDGVFGAGKGERRRKGIDPHGVLAEVRAFFVRALESDEGAPARRYLEERGLAAGVVDFGLGVHPRSPGALLRFARKRRLPAEVLEQAGLLRRADDGGWREPYAGRLMFPIEDARGRVVAFGGRVLDDRKPKYINSSESPFFRKREVLYGLRQVKDAGERRIVVVEGYTDVIAAHLAGFRGAVATLGTALTPDHGRVLARYASEGVTVLFDGDAAGRQAAEKAYGELVRTELALRLAILPEGMDPADLLAPRPGRDEAELEQRRERFAELLEGAEEALTMWFRLKRARMDLTLESSVAAVVAECGRVLDGVDDAARREILLARMAQMLGVSESAMRGSLGRRRRVRNEGAEVEPTTVAAPERDAPMARSDAELLACILADPEVLAEVPVDERVDDPAVARLIARAREAGPGDADQLTSLLFTACHGDGRAADLLARCRDVARSIADPEESLRALLAARREYRTRAEAQCIRRELQEARSRGDTARVDELTHRYIAQLRGEASA